MTAEQCVQTGGMSGRALNLLEEPLIRVEMKDGVCVKMILPDVCAALAADRVGTFPALRRHQTHAWHAFLVQIATMGLEALGAADPPGDDPSDWAAVLRGADGRLAQETSRGAWSRPPTVPALLQGATPGSRSPPVREAIQETRADAGCARHACDGQ